MKATNNIQNEIETLWMQDCKRESCFEHYQIVAYNGRKFKLTVKYKNGDPCGFNTNCYISAMTQAGDFNSVADNRETGAPYRNDYTNLAAAPANCNACIKAMLNYIKAVY